MRSNTFFSNVLNDSWPYSIVEVWEISDEDEEELEEVVEKNNAGLRLEARLRVVGEGDHIFISGKLLQKSYGFCTS